MNADNQIATGLARIGTFLRAERWRRADPTGLSPTQAQILSHLATRGPARVSEVASEIAVTQPTASDSVAALVRKRLVEKRADPNDARATRLQPTRAGTRLARDLAGWPDVLLGAIDGLEIEERAVFLRGLTKMIRTLQVRGAIPVQRMCVTCKHFRPNVHDDPDTPHHCQFVDAPFGDTQLRLDCGDHDSASESNAESAWQRFVEIKRADP